ncbi:MAG: ribonuclease III [Flavobacteriales bacterium]|nr:ribonuclease III [Flavobacteriales bacterium]
MAFLVHKNPRDKIIRQFIINTFGTRPKKIELYRQAFTHKSYALNHGNDALMSNERLEFLGDAILGAIIADYLCDTFPEKSEGELTEIRAQIVKRNNLNHIALEMGFEPLIDHATDSEIPHTSLAGNALEALIGAIYIDKGYEKTRKALVKALVPNHIHPDEIASLKKNAKSRLLEWGQRERKQISFRSKKITLAEGKDIFEVVVVVNGEKCGQGSAVSKKAAEFEAALQALEKLDGTTSS